MTQQEELTAMEQPSKIQEASGKLGVLTPGMGAVSTTFIAGVEAIKAGIGEPIGSLTQMGHIRLGKRTDDTSPLIKDFVPLAGLDDLVFGGLPRRRIGAEGSGPARGPA